MSLKILVLLTILPLAGCTFAPLELVNTLGYFFADGITEAQTGKGIVDNAVSGVMNKDCKVKNIFKNEEKLCKKNNKEGFIDEDRHDRSSHNETDGYNRME